MFEFFRGVPKMQVTDNLKAGVSRSSRYEPELNPAYEEMARHYGTAVIPARPKKPHDEAKAKVEVAVQLVERWVLAVLRNRQFFTLGELNQAMTEQVHQLNHRYGEVGGDAAAVQTYGNLLLDLLDSLGSPLTKPLLECNEILFGPGQLPVIWFRKKPASPGHQVVRTAGSLVSWPNIKAKAPNRDLVPELKWTTEFLIHPERPHKSFMVLGDLFQIKRGLATGANKFFIMSEEQADSPGIPNAFLRPILPRNVVKKSLEPK